MVCVPMMPAAAAAEPVQCKMLFVAASEPVACQMDAPAVSAELVQYKRSVVAVSDELVL